MAGLAFKASCGGGVNGFVDTSGMRDDEIVVDMPTPELIAACPNCGCQKAAWDCAGCGYEFVA